MGTKHILTSANQPSSNELVDAFQGIFKQRLLFLVGEHPETWPQYVDAVLRGAQIEDIYDAIIVNVPKWNR